MSATSVLLSDAVRRKLAAAKAEKGLSWPALAQQMSAHGMPTTAQRLMAKNSRGAFKATELILLMRILGKRFIDLSDVDLSAAQDADRG